MQNGNIASWYQMASSMYIMETCGTTDGFVLRTGHLQDRHTTLLQSEMACDVLKLTSFCFAHSCPALQDHWARSCHASSYSVPACDVDCSGAMPRAGQAVLAFVFGALALL